MQQDLNFRWPRRGKAVYHTRINRLRNMGYIYEIYCFVRVFGKRSLPCSHSPRGRLVPVSLLVNLFMGYSFRTLGNRNTNHDIISNLCLSQIHARSFASRTLTYIFQSVWFGIDPVYRLYRQKWSIRYWLVVTVYPV